MSTSIFVALSLLLPGPSAPSDTVRHTVFIQGNRAGSQRTVQTGGTTVILFEFNDRGRGPKTETHLTIGADGLPAAARITGNDYFKQPITEELSRAGGTFRWRNDAEQGDSRTVGFYLPLADAGPEVSAALARAILRAPARRLALLPTGEASIEEVARRSIESGGKQRTAVLYAIRGLGFAPQYVWLDAAGSFLATTAGWQRVLPVGWESIGDRLAAVQDSAVSRQKLALARQIVDRPGGPVAFVGVTLFDAPNARLLPDRTVVVEGNRIIAVGPSSETKPPAGARIIDGQGKTLLPGLWDMHSHLGGVDGPLDIAAGVTSARDLANDVEQLLASRAAFDRHDAIGPRVVMAGFMDGPGPFAGPTKALVSNTDQAFAWIDRYASLGYEQIKLYSSLDPALVAPIAERAHAKGMRLSGHIPRGMLAAGAVKAGYDEIQHTNMLFLNFLGDTLDTRTPQRFTAVAKFGADLDLSSDSVRAFLDLLKSHGTVIDPTLATFEEMFTADPSTMTEGNARIADRLPPEVRRGLKGGGLPADAATRTKYRASYAKMLAMVKALYDRGIPIVAGTDCMAGFCLHRELELYSQAGIPNADVLRIATWGAATVTRRTDRLGSIDQGKLADLILVAGDPVAAISDIRKVDLVMKDGVLFDPHRIYAALGVRSWRETRAATP